MIGIKDAMLPDGRVVDIIIEGEKIAQIKEGGTGPVEGVTQWHEGEGQMAVPGLIDAHVHFRNPDGSSRSEDWATGSTAARLGGVTTVFDMPNTLPPLTTVEGIERKLALVKSFEPTVDFRFWFGATANNLDEIRQAVHHPLVIGVKVFMGSSTGDLLVTDEDALRRIFSVCAEAGVIVGVHAEDEEMIQARRQAFERSRSRKPRVADHLWIRNPEVELMAVRRALRLQGETGCRLYLCHLSTPEAVELARRVKDEGREVYVEVTPHHLWLTAGKLREEREEDGAFFKVNPPLRRDDQVQWLWGYVLRGPVNTISSDHAPHTREEKERGEYDNIPSGVPGVQTLFSLIYHFVAMGQMSVGRFVELTSGNAAKIFGLEDKGRIEPGFDADLVVVGAERQVIFHHEAMASKCGWTPYHNMKFQGGPRLAVSQGVVTEL